MRKILGAFLVAVPFIALAWIVACIVEVSFACVAMIILICFILFVIVSFGLLELGSYLLSYGEEKK